MAVLNWERPKDPDETVDYEVLWGPQIGDNAIVSSAWPEFPAGLTKVSDSVPDATTTRVRLSGGTLDATYELVNRVTLDDGQVYDQTCRLKVKKR